jgi:hypothetical protein
MRKYIPYFFLLLALIIGLTACDSGEEAKEDEVVSNPKWQDADALMWAVDRYMKKEVFAKGRAAIPYKDEVSGLRWNLTPIALTKDVFLIGTETGYYSNIALTATGDTALIDFKLTWDASLKDRNNQPGDFRVEEVSLRKIGNAVRYEWKKDGKFYDKYPVKEYEAALKSYAKEHYKDSKGKLETQKGDSGKIKMQIDRNNLPKLNPAVAGKPEKDIKKVQ